MKHMEAKWQTAPRQDVRLIDGWMDGWMDGWIDRAPGRICCIHHPEDHRQLLLLEAVHSLAIRSPYKQYLPDINPKQIGGRTSPPEPLPAPPPNPGPLWRTSKIPQEPQVL